MRGFLYIFLLIFLALASCSKSPKCWGDDQDDGIIIESLDLENTSTPYYGIVINSEIEYNNIFKDSSYKDMPEIDFNNETLLGQYGSGDCTVKFIREVTEDETSFLYHYKLTVKECGWCEDKVESNNWVLVPKLPAGWIVTFEVE